MVVRLSFGLRRKERFPLNLTPWALSLSLVIQCILPASSALKFGAQIQIIIKWYFDVLSSINPCTHIYPTLGTSRGNMAVGEDRILAFLDSRP